jgi:hypothetical protein
VTIADQEDEAEADDDEGPRQAIRLDLGVIHEDENAQCPPQFVNIAAGRIAPQGDGDGLGPEDISTHTKIIDGYLYAGKKAHESMHGCEYIVTDRVSAAYMTTAALRRSGCHPERSDPDEQAKAKQAACADVQALAEHKDLHEWLVGDGDPDSTMLGGTKFAIPETLVLHPYHNRAVVQGTEFIIIPSNKERVIVGRKMAATVDTLWERDESPLQGHHPHQLSDELAQGLDLLERQVLDNEQLQQGTKEATSDILRQKYSHAWNAKYDLQKPAALPPMVIKLKPEATPARIRRKYRWTTDQRQFLRKLLRKLVNVGIISRVNSEWCCPVVLVIKPDKTWRLCVDPSALNKATVPMVWEIPRVREVIQEKLTGMKWMCRFDFVSMF